MNKILEQLISNRLTNFLAAQNLLTNRQYGFRKGCDTLTATGELLEEVYCDLDNRRYSGALFLDLKKAFDTINHELLLKKLEINGIRGPALHLLENYLSNRQQFVSWCGTNSSNKMLTIGVPQGSNLGPLMFLVFINDLSKLQLQGTPRLFADDTLISYSSPDPIQIAHWMNSDLLLLNEYLNCNLLSLNTTKTTYMLFNSGRRPIPELPCISITNTEIHRVKDFKYLGLVLDENLTWSAHIEQLKKKLAPVCGALWKVSSFVPTAWLKKLYFALFHSRLQYLVSLWGNAARSRLRELQCMQNRALKAVHRRPYLYPSVLLYNDIEDSVLPIRGLREFQSITFIHRILTCPETHHNTVLQRVASERASRQANLIRLPRVNTEFGKRKLSYFGSTVYNGLPENLKQTSSIHRFKIQLTSSCKQHISRYLH